MASSEGSPTKRQSISQLQETIDDLRAELNEATNSGESSRAELAKLRAEMQTAKDELAAAKQPARPAEKPEGGEHGKREGQDGKESGRPAFGWRVRR